MQNFGLDFGHIIGYFVPGVVALVAVWYVSCTVKSLVASITESDRSFGGIFLVTILGLGIGMIVSVLRAGTLDRSFRYIEIPMLPGVQDRVNPDYSNLVTDVRLAALVEARNADKRPYQFYGNILLATIFVVIARCFAINQTARGWAIMHAFVIIPIVVVVLYPASRSSHYRYMKSVEALNALPRPYTPASAPPIDNQVKPKAQP